MKTIIIIGDGKVGKTTFIQKYLSQTLEERYLPTLGVDIYDILLPNGEPARIRDFAGIKEFRINRDALLKNADFAIIMFDLTSKSSWQNVDDYLDKLDPDMPVLLCGNKLDEKRRRAISQFILGREYNLLKLEYQNVVGLVEMSVKMDINIKTPFIKLVDFYNNTRTHSPVLF